MSPTSRDEEGAAPPGDVVVVGAGAIGRRHLEALTRLSPQDRVVVVDPDPAALGAARAVFSDAGPEVHGAASVAEGAGHLDRPPIVIVATTADVRRDVTTAVLDAMRPSAIVLEKVLFQRPGDYAAVAAALADAGVPAWVNHPRAYSPVWLELAELLAGATGWVAEVTGSGWGLACNAAHFTERLLPHGARPAVDTSGLDPAWVPARRPGFYDVTGRLGLSVGPFVLELADPGAAVTPPEVVVRRDDACVTIRERGTVASVEIRGHHGRVVHGSRTHPVPMQSGLTDRVVRELRSGGSCALPTYRDVSPHHEAIVSALLGHFGPSTETDGGRRCPVT